MVGAPGIMEGSDDLRCSGCIGYSPTIPLPSDSDGSWGSGAFLLWWPIKRYYEL